jgi:hypothetical protein
MSESKRAPVTIVGGRPMHRAVAVSDLPVGLEQVLTIAGLNFHFRRRLQEDPAGAAAGVGIDLDQTELELLGSVSAEQLEGMARRTVPPAGPSRRQFIRNVAASVVALVAGDAFLLCSGCTGADTWSYDQGPHPDRSPDRIPASVNKMVTLAGHVCYLYVPGSALPKYRLLQKFGFYSQPGRTELLGAEVECCGAHSPD